MGKVRVRAIESKTALTSLLSEILSGSEEFDSRTKLRFMEIQENDASFIRSGIGSTRQDISFAFTSPRNRITRGRHIISSLNIDVSCAAKSRTNWSLPASKTCTGSCQARVATGVHGFFLDLRTTCFLCRPRFSLRRRKRIKSGYRTRGCARQ